MSNTIRRDIHNSKIPTVCVSCEARHGGICGGLKPEELLELSNYSRIVDIPAGTVLLHQGEPITEYANVLRGVIKLSKLMEDGRQQIVGLQFAPDLLGRQHARVSNITAEAAVDSQICIFPRHALERIAANSADITDRLSSQTLRELNQAREWMVTLGRKTAIEKVASFLRLVATASDPENTPFTAARSNQSVEIELPLSRSEMADFLGLTTETVSRQMTNLRKGGLITLKVAQIVTIVDFEGLRRISGT